MKLREIEKVLMCFGFWRIKTGGTSHHQWKGVVDGKMKKVTLSACVRDVHVHSFLFRSIVKQSGLNPRVFIDKQYFKSYLKSAA